MIVAVVATCCLLVKLFGTISQMVASETGGCRMGGVLSNKSTCPGAGSEDFFDGVSGHKSLVSSVDYLLQKFFQFVFAKESRGRVAEGRQY